MAYSELIKNFDKIRDYMREFYVYGFRSRAGYTAKSARTYDDERRRIESWLGDYMVFRRDDSGKSVFLSVDSRRIEHNPLYEAFKARSFTDGSIFLHFALLDLLGDGRGRSVAEIQEELSDRYLSQLTDPWEPDASTLRNKLKEYTELGLFVCEKEGRVNRYRMPLEEADLTPLSDLIGFFAESEQLGVVGSYLADRFRLRTENLRFKHHYILYALDSEVLSDLLFAMDEKRTVVITIAGKRGVTAEHKEIPLRIYVSTQTGRQYFLGRLISNGRFRMHRLDNIRKVKIGEPALEPDRDEKAYEDMAGKLWGVSTGRPRS